MGQNTRQKRGSPVLNRPKVAREFSSGGVVFRRFGSEVKWLVAASVTNKMFPKLVWRLQKGWIDDSDEREVPGPIARGEIKASEDDLQKAALREVAEEGGVEAKIIQKIGSEKIFFKHPARGLILKFVTYYLMEWQKDLPEGFGEETSKVLWLSYDEARKKLSYSGEKKILDKANEILASLA